MEQLIAEEVRLSAGPVWLFRVGSDGLGREIIGRTIRPGKTYILVSEGEISLNGGAFERCDIDYAGIYSALISVPETLSSATISLLEATGLHVARTVRIWPAGLLARAWDGEGNSEWLTTDRPCFGIAHDHAVDGYNLRLDDNEEVAIKAPPFGAAALVSLPSLPLGRHTLRVKTRRIQPETSAGVPGADGIMTLTIREPEAWVPGTTSHAGLFVSVEPPDPSLDTFWEGDAAVSIMGPPGHRVACVMTLFTPKREKLLSEAIGTFELPVTKDEWQNRVLAIHQR
jgi:hypothetical protein